MLSIRIASHITPAVIRCATCTSGDVPIRLLRNVRGLELIPMEAGDWCCGFGGTFSIKNRRCFGSDAGGKLAVHPEDAGARYAPPATIPA